MCLGNATDIPQARCWAAALVVATLCFGGASARGDEVAAWLETRGLTSLLAAHLESELERARDVPQREQVASRLAAVYARLLEIETDAAVVADLDARGMKLLESVSGSEAEALRLALLGASQRAASRTAERHRLRLTSAAELAVAQATFDRIIPELRTLRKDLQNTLTLRQRKLSRAGGVDATILADDVEKAGRLVSQATFLVAWSAYYSGWISGETERVREAEGLFIELLDTGVASPTPADVSVDLRALEPYARAILGLGLSRAILQRPALAIEWLALLDHPNTYESLAREAPAWRLAALIDGRDWEAASAELDRLLSAPDPAPAPWIRLAAAHGLESAASSPAAGALAGKAVAALAGRGELAQVLDLAKRFGISALGERGFVLRYVRGVERFDAARAQHAEVARQSQPTQARPGSADTVNPADEPTVDRRAIELYESSANELLAGLREPDVTNFPEAAAAAEVLLGWCRYYANRLRDAAGHFEEAAARQGAADGAESLWMAIVCLDRLEQQGSDAETTAQLEELVARFLSSYPSSQRAPQLVLRRSRGAEPASPALVEQLLSVPANSALHADAQRRAVQILYELVRTGSGAARAESARRLLAVAVPLLEEDDTRFAELSPVEQESHLIRTRQAIEVSLDDLIDRPELAITLLDRLDEVVRRHGVDTAAISDELRFRRLQSFLALNDLAAAERLAAEMALDPGARTEPVWSRAVHRLMFRDAVERWRAAGPSGVDRPALLAPVVEWGRRVLAEAEAIADPAAMKAALTDRAMIPALQSVVEAGGRWWQQNNDAALARETLARAEVILSVRPSDALLLRWGAVLAQGVGENEKALERLRTLLAGAPTGTELWFEAKWRLLTILSQTDPPRARDVMNQHKALHPEYGPEPWRERLRGLDARIPASPSPAPSADAPADTPASSPAGGGS